MSHTWFISLNDPSQIALGYEPRRPYNSTRICWWISFSPFTKGKCIDHDGSWSGSYKDLEDIFVGNTDFKSKSKSRSSFIFRQSLIMIIFFRQSLIRIYNFSRLCIYLTFLYTWLVNLFFFNNMTYDTKILRNLGMLIY